MVKDGQKFVEPLQYSPLSKEAVVISEKLVKSMTYNGITILK